MPGIGGFSVENAEMRGYRNRGIRFFGKLPEFFPTQVDFLENCSFRSGIGDETGHRKTRQATENKGKWRTFFPIRHLYLAGGAQAPSDSTGERECRNGERQHWGSYGGAAALAARSPNRHGPVTPFPGKRSHRFREAVIRRRGLRNACARPHGRSQSAGRCRSASRSRAVRWSSAPPSRRPPVPL